MECNLPAGEDTCEETLIFDLVSSPTEQYGNRPGPGIVALCRLSSILRVNATKGMCIRKLKVFIMNTTLSSEF